LRTKGKDQRGEGEMGGERMRKLKGFRCLKNQKEGQTDVGGKETSPGDVVKKSQKGTDCQTTNAKIQTEKAVSQKAGGGGMCPDTCGRKKTDPVKKRRIQVEENW